MLRMLLTVCVLVALIAPAPVQGQVNDDAVANHPEKNVEPLPEAKPVAEYGLAAGILVVALGLGFFPSKRSHD